MAFARDVVENLFPISSIDCACPIGMTSIGRAATVIACLGTTVVLTYLSEPKYRVSQDQRERDFQKYLLTHRTDLTMATINFCFHLIGHALNKVNF